MTYRYILKPVGKHTTPCIVVVSALTMFIYNNTVKSRSIIVFTCVCHYTSMYRVVLKSLVPGYMVQYLADNFTHCMPT